MCMFADTMQTDPFTRAVAQLVNPAAGGWGFEA